MIAFAKQTAGYSDTIIISPYARVNGPTVSAWADAPTAGPEIYWIEVPAQREPDPTDIFKNVEPFWRRRWRLSLEAIDRYRRAARKVRLRVANQWFRIRYVARVCAQSERWRVSV